MVGEIFGSVAAVATANVALTEGLIKWFKIEKKWMKVTICREGKICEISFKNGGKVDKPLKQIGTTKQTGTTVEFFPDEEIFGNAAIGYKNFEALLKSIQIYQNHTLLI